MRELKPVPLTGAAFTPYGEVIELDRAQQIPINQGLTTRFNDLASVDVCASGGRVGVSVFRSRPISLPHRVEVLERHPLGSQLFYPLSPARFLVLVAPSGDVPQADQLELFVSDGRQGINFHRNTWHHYQMVLERETDFIVVDRLGEGVNLEEKSLVGEAIAYPPD